MEKAWHLCGIIEQLIGPLLEPDPLLGFQLCGIMHFLTV